MTTRYGDFNLQMNEVIRDAAMEVDLQDEESIDCAVLDHLVEQLTTKHLASVARSRNKPSEIEPILQAIIKTTFELGFRAGRIFHARDYPMPEDYAGEGR